MLLDKTGSRPNYAGSKKCVVYELKKWDSLFLSNFWLTEEPNEIFRIDGGRERGEQDDRVS